jgi:hypothetical protein
MRKYHETHPPTEAPSYKKKLKTLRIRKFGGNETMQIRPGHSYEFIFSAIFTGGIHKNYRFEGEVVKCDSSITPTIWVKRPVAMRTTQLSVVKKIK